MRGLVPAALAVLALAAVVTAAGPAIAQGRERPTAQLVYLRPASLSVCPGEEAVRSAVSGRLGYNPFDERSTRTLVARITAQGRSLRAEVELRNASGRLLGARTLSSAKRDCRELASAMVLALSLAIDPDLIARGGPAAAPVPVPAPAPPPAPEPTPEPAPEPAPGAAPAPAPSPGPVAAAAPPDAAAAAAPGPSPRPRLQLGLGLLATLGAAPSTAAPGFSAEIGVRGRRLSLALEGRADVPIGIRSAAGTVKAGVLLASLVPCVHFPAERLDRAWQLLTCAVGSVGALRGEGQELGGRRQTTLFAALGPRLGVELRLARSLRLRLHADLLGTLTPTTLRINGATAWTTPPVSGALGATLLARF